MYLTNWKKEHAVKKADLLKRKLPLLSSRRRRVTDSMRFAERWSSAMLLFASDEKYGGLLARIPEVV
jgi:hypothetical protein